MHVLIKVCLYTLTYIDLHTKESSIAMVDLSSIYVMSEVEPSVDQQSSSSQATWLICNDHKTLFLTIIRER